MSKQLETILDMLGVNYAGCHNCKFKKSDICKTCIPINWKLNQLLKNDYTGCHNCIFFNPEINWIERTNECKVCVPNNWEPDKNTEIKL